MDNVIVNGDNVIVNWPVFGPFFVFLPSFDGQCNRKWTIYVQCNRKQDVELQLYLKRQGDNRTFTYNYTLNGSLIDNRSPATGLPTAKSWRPCEETWGLSTKLRHQCMYLTCNGFSKYAQRDAYDNHAINECSYTFISVTQIRKSIMKETLQTPFCAY